MKGPRLAPSAVRAHRLTCPEPDCGAPMVLRDSRHGLFYGCSRFPECKSTHGARPDGSPQGTPADGPTRAARAAAHDQLEALRMARRWTPRQARIWLADRLGTIAESCNIADFDAATCERILRICAQARGLDRKLNDALDGALKEIE